MATKEASVIPVPFDEFWERLPNMPNMTVVIETCLISVLHENLKLQMAFLDDTLQEKMWRDDRPGLLELVDPIMHCFVAGVTTKEFPQNSPFETPCVQGRNDKDYSQKFQLLPTEFFVDPESKKATALSYINNLDPRIYEDVYSSIENVVGAAIPHFEKVLSQLVTLDKTNDVTTISLEGRPLQIIIGIKNILLTPEGTSVYGGSDWHTEGFKNERIVASAIYYYDINNITNSQLAFRFQTHQNKNYSVLGHATAQSNLLVVFPNVYEHSVRPFELDDKSAAGHRKFITLFLVDPHYKILSTDDVAPQQESWYPISGDHSSTLFRAEEEYTTKGRLSLDQAKTYRVQAAKERKEGVKTTVIRARTTNRNRSRADGCACASRRRRRSGAADRRRD